MAADLILAVGLANLAAAAAILLVLTLRKILRRAFGARVAYRLWLLVPLAAAATLLPARRIVEAAPAPPISTDAIAFTAGETVTGWGVQAGTSIVAPSIATLAVAVWIAGSLLGLVVLLLKQRRSVARLGRLAPDRTAGIWRASHPAVGPAVIGVISPRIVLPADFDTRFDADEQAVVLAHEGHHLAAQDARLNALASLVQCLCWFNPLVHLAVRRFRTDQELACDETVLSRFPHRRRTYADALLKTQLAAAPLPLGCYWPARTASPLRERIAMLKQDLPTRTRRLAGAGLVLALAAGGGAAAWAAKPAERVYIAAETAVTAPANPSPPPLAPLGVPAPATPRQAAFAAAQPPAPPAPAQPAPAAPPPPPRVLAAGDFPAWPTWPEWPTMPKLEGFTALDGQLQMRLQDQGAEVRRQMRNVEAQTRAVEAQRRAIERQAQDMSRDTERSSERAKAMAEIAELMKPTPAELERLRQIAELSKPTEAELERYRKLAELRAQRSPEQIERQRRVRAKMRELGMTGSVFVPPAPPPPPAPPVRPVRPERAPRAIPAPPPPPAPPPVCENAQRTATGWTCLD